MKTLDRLRIARYNYDDGTYNDTDNCIWGLSSFTDGNCSNWGNPLSEMYLEAVRYYAGLSANSAFDATDSGYIPGLATASWSDPIDEDNWCAHCDVIVFNASEPSYDNDSLSSELGWPDRRMPRPRRTQSATPNPSPDSDWFVGENGSDNNQLCTGKTVNAFGSVEGPARARPGSTGTYLVSGLAHWAHTNDIRTGPRRTTRTSPPAPSRCCRRRHGSSSRSPGRIARLSILPPAAIRNPIRTATARSSTSRFSNRTSKPAPARRM